ncbi:probable serine carboxypeptidase CPVL [Physella acuta]|uniref:probable serine carboxypeptidase CPVL n=1 Tax=Physella acuta TaxID=109671 RepID=UPI0027DD8607|nr:probable serine carboxypeptidase CPVL [Physella acuta]
MLGYLLTLSCLHFVTTLCVGEEEPLLLTPYLNNGSIEQARKLSSVDPRDFPLAELNESYAGYITANQTLGNHLFFWFFPSANNSHAPLLVWLNGGPMISSMVGLLWENGPLEIFIDDMDYLYLKKRRHSWADPFSMLYVDSPVGAGYSYTESGAAGVRATHEGITLDLYSFLEQFYVMFPEYKHRELYIGGQSYAGKYIPHFAHYIHQQIQNKKTDIPLTGIYIGGAFYDPPVQNVAYFEYLYSMGVISHAQKRKYQRVANQELENFQKNSKKKLNMIDIQLLVLPYVGLFTLDNYVTDEQVRIDDVKIIMSSGTTSKAVHVGNRTFVSFNLELFEKFGQEFFVSVKPEMAVLMNSYKVLLFSGDYDVIVSSVTVDMAVQTTPWTGQKSYNQTRRTAWVSEDGRVRGFYSQTDRFCRVVVKGAGHQTPRDQPETTLDMMMQFVEHGCITPIKHNFRGGQKHF